MSDPVNHLSDMLLAMLERVTTLSVQVETLRALLEARGGFTAAEFDQQAAELRKRWQLIEHPFVPLREDLTAEEYFARARRFWEEQAGATPPPAADA